MTFYNLFILFGVIPFVPLYIGSNEPEVKRRIPVYVTSALLTSNSLKLVFWCHPTYYDVHFFAEAVINMITMFCLIYVVLRTQAEMEDKRHIHDCDLCCLFNWTNTVSYIESVGVIIFLCVVVFRICGEYIVFNNLVLCHVIASDVSAALYNFIDIIGVEYCSWTSRRITIVSVLAGILKLNYVVNNMVPSQILIGGILQLLLHIATLLKNFYFTRSK